MEYRVIQHNNKYYPQWKNFLFWHYFWFDATPRTLQIWCDSSGWGAWYLIENMKNGKCSDKIHLKTPLNGIRLTWNSFYKTY